MGDSAEFRTVCPRNCYCTCGMVVTVEAGRITRIEGDPLNPATGGHVCLKGLSYARRVASPDRLLVPLRRAPGSDRFEPVSWEAALSDISARLDRLRGEQGPESALYYEGSGSHGALGQLSAVFWRQFGGCTLTYGDLCWPAGLEATRLTYGRVWHSHPRFTRDSRFVLLWGHNPAETNVHQMRLIQEAKDRGAVVALVDPRSTDTSDAADIHLQPRPGTDAALALGLARLIIENGWHAEAFLARHASGVDRFVDRLGDYPIGRVAEITGVAPRAIRELAEAYATTKPALLIAGFGLQRHRHAGQTMRAVALLPALTGNVGIAGGGWQYANLASHCLKEPALPPEHAATTRGIPVSRLGPALGELSAPPVRAAWIERGNPASQHPDSGEVRRRLAALDLVVVVDQFMTDTARLAHYVLPAKTLFEETDLVTAYWHPYVQLRPKILEPPGEVKTETEIWRLMCGRFGFDTGWFPDPVDPLPWLRRLMPDGREEALDRLAREPLDLSGWGDIAFADRTFPTPSGKVEFWSDETARLWGLDPLPAYETLAEGHDAAVRAQYPLHLLTCKTRDRIHSQFGNLDWVKEVERPHLLDIHPHDAGTRGLADGDMAEVFNGRGRIRLRVRLDCGLRPGVVHVIEGRSHDGDPDVNLLTEAAVTDMNHGATFYECLVEVRRLMPGGGRP